MVKINLSEMSVFVRNQADTDDVDAPDSTLTVYARAAYRDIQSRIQQWPDKKEEFTFTTVAGTSGYLFSGMTDSDMEYVSTVRTADDGLLIYLSVEEYDELSSGSSASTGTPTCYAVDSAGIWLWPTPASTGVTYTVRGFRSFAAWPSGSNEPDLPRGFDEAICWYMLSRYYQAQEDLELAQMYMMDFNRTVNAQIERAVRGSSGTAGPKIFGGDPRLTSGRMTYDQWMKRNVEG